MKNTSQKHTPDGRWKKNLDQKTGYHWTVVLCQVFELVILMMMIHDDERRILHGDFDNDDYDAGVWQSPSWHRHPQTRTVKYQFQWARPDRALAAGAAGSSERAQALGTFLVYRSPPLPLNFNVVSVPFRPPHPQPSSPPAHPECQCCCFLDFC